MSKIVCVFFKNIYGLESMFLICVFEAWIVKGHCFYFVLNLWIV